ncbi:TenA family transcriptional regulator [Janthinobacterium fluminis]|uniref:Iron-containing redox enzyme family protein n=1 Tax=Janthinobacterium fluminis TaxID=2987524 RepID=A0ABT5K835_9BURK|nr:iron-containing redox enzyme family protein [Janthinobacterium fluminis]MDC8759912.1 iron-containing redox enzyme family protein [Janthinobacterium fluminis]
MQNKEFQRTGPLMDLHSYPAWAQDMMQATVAAKEKVVGHELFAMMREASLPAGATYQFLVGGWPVIEQFPQYMAVNLCKIQYGRSPGENMARRYLMRNIRVEQNHADHWVEWAKACGIGMRDLFDSQAPVESQALNHWCWHSCERASLATSMAVTNLAIEGSTGEWATQICSTDTYEQSFSAELRRAATRWLRLHAQYDDTHPWEALEIICMLIGRQAESKYVDILVHGISNSYQYMKLSLDRSLALAG